MGNLNVGDRFVNTTEDMDIIEQNRLQALIEITEQHNKEVTQLKSRIETSEQKSDKLNKQLKAADAEMKALRVHNPDRMKKQIKRLQEQNRTLTGENATLKTKQKQLTKQLDSSQQELEQLREETSKKEGDEESK